MIASKCGCFPDDKEETPWKAKGECVEEDK